MREISVEEDMAHNKELKHGEYDEEYDEVNEVEYVQKSCLDGYW